MPSRMPKTGNEMKTAKRLVKDLWIRYKKELILVAIFLLLTSISNTVGSIFTPRIIDEVITPVVKYHTKTFDEVQGLLLKLIIAMGSMYLIGIVSALFSLFVNIYTWWKKAKSDGKITKEELDELKEIVDNHTKKDDE